MENTYMNDLGTTKIKRALDAVVSPVDGSSVCRSTVDGPDALNPTQGASDPNCVPWDIFTTGNVTQDQLDYLVLPLFARGTTDQTVISGYVTGYLGDYGVQLPWADTGLSVVAGLEYREENLNFNPDEGFRLGEGAGQGGATGPVNGGYDLSEIFLEAQIPFVQGASWAEDLSMDLAYRYSDYSTGIDTNTYGVRLGWAINNDIKFRASHQRAIRAANVQELFLPQGFNLFDMDEDPCGVAQFDNPPRTTPARSAAASAKCG